MKKIFIKYNPYKLETEITVDGKELAQNSKLGEMASAGSYLQEWIEELPHILIEEYNDTDFEITFHGTHLDFEDLVEIFTLAYERGEVTAKLSHEPAKETADKETLIDEVFQEILEGEIAELKSDDIKNAFKEAKSDEFEVCVVATMSAGKSTLVNAMLREKLMPSKQEACTAIITRIKDTDSEEWKAEVFDKEGKGIKPSDKLDKLTYEIMKELNENENVSEIKVSGNIPFVTAEETSLVLIDTPGPNNARELNHGKTQNDFLKKSSKALVLYIMEPTFVSGDNDKTLRHVADSMSVNGKKSKDRFIFVVNKLDDRKQEDSDNDMYNTLKNIRDYLGKHKIENPNLFPIAALPALNIRLMTKGVNLDVDTIDETEVKVRKLNRNPELHLEKYAPLPKSICNNINERLAEAERTQDVNTQALIHTGILSVEAAIRQYVQKYAKTAKIKNIVEVFSHKLEAAGCYEKLKREIIENQDKSDEIVRQIEEIRQKIDNVNSAKKFKESVDNAVKRVNEESVEVIENISAKFRDEISKRIDACRGQELSIEETDYEIQRLERFAKKLEPDFRESLGELIQENLIKTSRALLEEYKKKLISLTDELSGKKDSESGKKNEDRIPIDVVKLMEGNVISSDDFAIYKYVQTKKVEDGEEWVENTDKKWYKPWTWFQERGYYRTKYKEVRYIDAGEVAQIFLAPVQDSIYANADSAREQAKEQSKSIAVYFNQKFKELDGILDEKLSKLEKCATDKENVEKLIFDTEKNLRWLEDITQKVESILEI